MYSGLTQINFPSKFSLALEEILKENQILNWTVFLSEEETTEQLFWISKSNSYVTPLRQSLATVINTSHFADAYSVSALHTINLTNKSRAALINSQIVFVYPLFRFSYLSNQQHQSNSLAKERNLRALPLYYYWARGETDLGKCVHLIVFIIKVIYALFRSVGTLSWLADY